MNARFSKCLVSVLLIAALALAIVPFAGAQEGPTSDPSDPLIAYLLGSLETVIAPSEAVSQEAAQAYMSPRLITHDGGIPAVSVEGPVVPFLDWNNMERATMTDRRRTIEHIVRYGDLVWAHVVIDATLQKPWPLDWAQPTLERFQLPLATGMEQLVLFRFEDGAIAETWEYLDSPLIWYIFHNLICSGWQIPLAASDLSSSEVATVDDHVLLMEGEKIALVQEFFDRTVNAERPVAPQVMSLSLPVILHNPRGPEVWRQTPWSVSYWFNAMHRMMPDFQAEIQHIVEYEDMVWVHWRSTGTLTNPTAHPGLVRLNSLRMPRPVEAEGVYLFRFEGDKIAEWWWYEDNNLLTIATGDLCFAAF